MGANEMKTVKKEGRGDLHKAAKVFREIMNVPESSFLQA